MLKILREIRRLLADGEDLVLATVIARSGSTPRSAGARMIVRQGGATVGTIGGGLLEFESCRAAAGVLAKGGEAVMRMELTGRDAAAGDGMICGGSVEVLLERMDPFPENLSRIDALIDSIGKSRRGVLVRPLDTGEEPGISWGLLEDGAVVQGEIQAFPVAAALSGDAAGARRPRTVAREGRRYYIEPLAPAATLFLFGAGHVSRAVAELAGKVDFSVVVVDDRGEYANEGRFPAARRITVVPSFSDAFEGLEIDGESYLVVLTRGHLHDRTVLEGALKTGAAYIGMIASRRKRDLIYEELLKEGFSRTELERVHSPIGVAIGAETPEEIAVSIVAELIKVRAGRRG